MSDYPILKGKGHATPTPKSHASLWAFLIAALPQLIPGGGIIADYFKSFPTTFFYKNKLLSGWNNKAPHFARDGALINAMWIGGQAITVDILLSGFAETSNLLPYMRALVCGIANQYFNVGGGFLNEPGKWPYGWAAIIYGSNNPGALESLYSLWSFLLGFLAMKNNVGGSPAASAALGGLATGSSMILNPSLFYSFDVNPSGLETAGSGTYLKIIAGFVLVEALVAKILEGRVSQTALNVLIGLTNAVLRYALLNTYVDKYLSGVTLKNPSNPLPLRTVAPPSYAFY